MDFARAHSRGKFHFFVLSFIRILLLVAIFSSFYSGRKLVLTMAVAGLLATFIPAIVRAVFKKRFPAELEILVLLAIYGLLIFSSVKYDYHNYFLWNLFINFGAGAILGFVGLTVLMVLTREELLDANPGLIVFMAFCFSFSLGGLFEIFEFFVDSALDTGLQAGLTDTMNDLIFGALGAGFVSLFGYRRLNGRSGAFGSFVFELMKRNLRIFRGRRYIEYSSRKILSLIESGESDQLEFKSTLRKNLHTGKIDKRIEHAVLKTIVAYLNSKGGTLLVGVDDKGRVVGLENDDFENNDKLKLYLTGILRRYVGNPFLPYIDYELYPVKDKHVLKIECRPSKKRVFLKTENGEEFYVRYGPSSVKLLGNDLIEYVEERFG